MGSPTKLKLMERPDRVGQCCQCCQSRTKSAILQGASDKTRILRTSKLWKNHCWYWNKRYLSKKPLITALIWHPESGRGIIRRRPRPLAVKSIFCWIFTGAEGFWLFAFYDISRRPLLSYSHFQGVKLKLRSRAFCWGIVCFCTSNGSFRILILKSVWFGLLHPVY